MTTLLTVLHVIVCLFLMLTVLLQSGKGGGMGAAFGGGNAATVFGGSGASTFLRKLTAGAVTVFMLDSMTLAFLASRNSGDALEKFGEQEQARAKAKADARNAAHGGSNAVTPFVPPAGSAGVAPIMLGSGAAPAPSDDGIGSAIAPEAPIPPATTGSAANKKDAQPATTPSMQVAPPAKDTKVDTTRGSNNDNKPADQKPTGTTPAANPNVPTP
jgi:preprotein translocase subunit SecG